MRTVFETIVSGLEQCQMDPETGEITGTIVRYSDHICVAWPTVEDSSCADAEANAISAMESLIKGRFNKVDPPIVDYYGEGYAIRETEPPDEQFCGEWVAVAGYTGNTLLEGQGLNTAQLALEACEASDGRPYEAIAGLEERAGGSCATW